MHRVLLNPHTMHISAPPLMGHHHSSALRTFLVFRSPDVL